MIKTYEQAVQVQKTRFQNGKNGLAKAIHRYLKRTNQLYMGNRIIEDSLEQLEPELEPVSEEA